MAILVPIAYSTYADATTTEGGPLCKYVLAQVRSDANLSWVADVKRALGVDELKWRIMREYRPRLRNMTDLWSAIEVGKRQATIVVIDPEPLGKLVKHRLMAEGAEEGRDFDDNTIIEGCASALVQGTPVAYLPTDLAKVVNCYPTFPHATFEDFTPDAIRSKIGRGLRDARVFAARAHATFDLSTHCGNSTTDAFRSPATPLVVAELLSTMRYFDNEHAKSAEFLNQATDAIADALENVLTTPGTVVREPLIKEYDSTAIDHLQAADVAAGWARELLELADLRALARSFERVLMNGAIIKE
jgi:hypothetical protein